MPSCRIRTHAIHRAGFELMPSCRAETFDKWQTASTKKTFLKPNLLSMIWCWSIGSNDNCPGRDTNWGLRVLSQQWATKPPLYLIIVKAIHCSFTDLLDPVCSLPSCGLYHYLRPYHIHTKGFLNSQVLQPQEITGLFHRDSVSGNWWDLARMRSIFTPGLVLRGCGCPISLEERHSSNFQSGSGNHFWQKFMVLRVFFVQNKSNRFNYLFPRFVGPKIINLLCQKYRAFAHLTIIDSGLMILTWFPEVGGLNPINMGAKVWGNLIGRHGYKKFSLAVDLMIPSNLL